jgi:polyisoprenoid-binding protein YceI
VSGDLTIRGTTRPVSWDVVLEGIGTDQKGGQHLGATAATTIDRRDFGLTWNQPIQNGVMVGDKVKIEVGLEALDEATAKQWGLAA